MSNRLLALAIAQLTIFLAQTSAQAADAIENAGHHMLSAPRAQKVKVSASAILTGNQQVVSVSLKNKGKTAALAVQLELVDEQGYPLPDAWYSDNDVTVLPGEPRTIQIRYPAHSSSVAFVNVRGWNVADATVRAAPAYDPAYLPPYWQQPVIAPSRPAVSATSTVTPRH
jgi:hypothetical protein